ncbi:MAG: transposase [Patescibacteria group bacterium]
MAEEEPSSLTSIAKSQRIPAKEFEKQYKDHLSGFQEWNQKNHCEEWLLFEKNIGEKLSIDETAISGDELHTIITNKTAKGRRGAIVAMVGGVKALEITAVLEKISKEVRDRVKEVTLDMSNAMDLIVRTVFKNATIVTDRFHVQQLVSEALQEIRIALRREVLKEENEEFKLTKLKKKIYQPTLLKNGDTKKQLIARSRGLLFKPTSKWSASQQTRSIVLFEKFPELKKAYDLSMMFRNIYETNFDIPSAKKALDKWYQKVKEENIEAFNIPAESIRWHETTILNYFINRSTNASAESFNAKLKGFRSVVRGVRDKKFFLYRIAKLYG